MKKVLCVVAAGLMLFLTSCNFSSNKTIDISKAQQAIIDQYPDAEINGSKTNGDTDFTEYIFEFTTGHGHYIGHVNAKNGKIISVEVKNSEDLTKENQESLEVGSSNVSRIDGDKALDIAKKDTGETGPGVLIKNKYNSDDNTYDIIIKARNKEYTYKIDTQTGEILSKDIQIDS